MASQEEQIRGSLLLAAVRQVSKAVRYARRAVGEGGRDDEPQMIRDDGTRARGVGRRTMTPGGGSPGAPVLFVRIVASVGSTR